MLVPLCIPALAQPPLVRDARVVDDTMPRYVLSVSLSDTAREWKGTGTVTFTNPTGQPLSELPLVLPPNASTSIARFSVTRIEVTQGPAATFAVGHPSDGLLTFERPLAPSEAVTVAFDFHAPLRQLDSNVNDIFAQGMGQLASLGAGGGGGDYGLLAAGDGIVVAASAFPVVRPFVDGSPAHRVLRGDQTVGDVAWNTPASFSVRLEVPAGLSVVTNLADKVVESDATRQVIQAEGVGVTDFVVVGARDWVVAEETVGTVKVRSWARAKDKVAGQAVLASGVKALRLLERLSPYPFTELDLVEASLVGGAGGVEFSGMALVAGFLYQDASSSGLGALLPMLGSGMASLDLGSQRDFVVAHEVAHQWSPALVGADAWNEPVLDEALAQYLAWRVVTDGKPASSAATVMERNVTLNYALFRLMGGKDGAAARPTSAFASSLEYAALVYGKAPGLYVALEKKVGRATMDKALAHAVSQNRWKTVDHETFLQSLERGGATGAVALGTRWWEEAHGDEDLGIDPEGRAAMRMLVGEAMARQLEQVIAAQGMTPAQWFSMFLSGMQPQPSSGSPMDLQKLLEQLLKQ
jgi:hypothetical protein